MKITRETPKQAEVIAMCGKLNALCESLYPAESNHFLGIDALVADHIHFLVARDDAGVALGCGALVNYGSFGEIKRMFVETHTRGQGIAGQLLAEIDAIARAAGLPVLRLETGIYQPEAIGLYVKHGYVRCGPYADYQPDPLSLFMEKLL